MNLSVIITVYNREQYVAQCLESVCNCPWEDLQIIVVDDGSSDNSALILKEFAQKDNRIEYYYQDNSWISVARNNGLSHVKNEYVIFIDDDDFLTDTWWKIVSRLYENKPDCDLYMFDYNEFIDGKYTYVNVCPNGMNGLNDFYYWYCTCIGYGWGKLYKTKNILENNLMFRDDVRFSEDSLFVREYMNYMSTVEYCPKSILNYRQHNESIMHNGMIHFKEHLLSSAGRASLIKEKNESFGITLYDYYSNKLANYLFLLKEIVYRNGYSDFIDKCEFARNFRFFQELMDTMYSTLNLRYKLYSNLLMSGKLKMLYSLFSLEVKLSRLLKKQPKVS